MSKLPWFKFYPADWRAEPALRMVSMEARGLWIECMCLMHEAEPYGYLIVRGVPLEVPSLAAIVGASEQQVRAGLHELEDAGVLSVSRDGIVFCRRMVRDAKNRERAKNHGKRGGNPALKNPVASNVYELPLKGEVKGGDKDTLKLRGQKLETRREANASVEAVFDALWPLWPAIARKRHPQQKVRDAIANQLKLGNTADQIIQAGRAHVAERLAKGPEFVKGLVPWLSQGLWKNWVGDEADETERKRRLWVFQTYGDWRPDWGPRPDADQSEAQGGTHDR
jgi:hypothetical protein